MTPRPSSVGVAGDVVREATDEEFDDFCDVIRRYAGIHLSPSKRALLHSRLLPRVRHLGLTSLGAYLRVVLKDRRELEAMIDRITTNETRFFREPSHFAHLASTIVPDWVREAALGHRPKSVTVWSAGCSTGEEPYSVAMFLRDLLPEREGWTVDILATDISTRALEVARQATWSLDRAVEIPVHLLKRFMLEGVGSQAGRIRAAPELRRMIKVDRLNLHEDAHPVPTSFDLVFCRNVMIYFAPDERRRVVERLGRHLARGGYLFVGHAESVQGVADLCCERPTIYAKAARCGERT